MSITQVEDDPVVKEIPVYLSKTLVDKLFLVQYTTQPAKETDEDSFSKSCVKPENLEIFLEQTIDTQSDYYDCKKGAQLVLNAEDKKEDEYIFDSDLMDKSQLSSLLTATEQSNLVVGIFQDDELHITPLKGVVEMRPLHSYLDKSDKRSKDESQITGEDCDEDEDIPSPVKVTFARHQPENMKKIQEQSFQYHKKKSLDEHWIHTTYVSRYDTQAELVRMEMFCPSVEESLNAPNLLSQQHMKHNYPSKEQPISEIKSRFLSIATLPLLDQVRTIMKKVRITSFVNLCKILSSEHDTVTILKYLQQVAVLVQGNWIVSSELIYIKDSLSSYNGIPAELMCRTRDYILLLFTQQQYLNRKTVLSAIKLPPMEINEIFGKLCKYEPRKGWQLIVPPNWDFCDRYPEITQRQEMFWDAKRKHLREAMEAQNQPQRQRRKSNRESLGSENEERNIGRSRKSLRDSSLSDDGVNESGKSKKINRSRKVSETVTT